VIFNEDSLNQYQNITFSTLSSKVKHKASIEVFLDSKLKNEVEKLFAFDLHL